MNKSLLIIFLIFFSWLFYVTNSINKNFTYAIDQICINFRHQQKNLKDEEPFIIFPGNENVPPILLNKITGESWRFFRNTNAQGIPSQEGWMEISFFENKKE